ncbi:MAG: glycosyltransferase [Thomasclavelia sp.]
MRILHVIGKRPTGGIGTVVKNYQKHLPDESCKFDYMIFNDIKHGDFDRFVENMGSKVYVLSKLKNRRLFKINYEIKQFFKEHAKEYDIVHLHSANIGFMIFKYAKKYGIKVRIIHSHATKYSDKKINGIRNYFLYKPSVKMATHYFYCSELARTFLFPKIESNLYFMHNAIDSNYFKFNASSRNRLRGDLGIDDNTLVLINTARFCNQKNQKFLIELANELRNRHVSFLLLLVGEGENKKEIEILVERYLLQDNVKFLGFRSDINDLLSCADIYCLPSLYEGLPLSIVEAECNGIFSIISDTVTKELSFISEICNFCSINGDAYKRWADIIQQTSFQYNRSLAYIEADKFHYNIRVEASILVSKYKEFMEEVEC